MLFGMSLVYGTTGAVHFDAVFLGLAHPFPATSASTTSRSWASP